VINTRNGRKGSYREWLERNVGGCETKELHLDGGLWPEKEPMWDKIEDDTPHVSTCIKAGR
jgi:hypothetical protein